MQHTLLDIGDDLRALDALIEESGGELSTPEVEAAFVSLFEQLALEEGTKLDGCVNYLRRLESEVSLARAEAEQYQTHARVRENRIARFKAFLMEYLSRSGRTKVTTATGRTVAVQANGGVAPIRWVYPETVWDDETESYVKADPTAPDPNDPETLPPQFVVMKKCINTDAIRRGLEEADPEAKKIAILDARGFHLRVR